MNFRRRATIESLSRHGRRAKVMEQVRVSLVWLINVPAYIPSIGKKRMSARRIRRQFFVLSKRMLRNVKIKARSDKNDSGVFARAIGQTTERKAADYKENRRHVYTRALGKKEP